MAEQGQAGGGAAGNGTGAEAAGANAGTPAAGAGNGTGTGDGAAGGQQINWEARAKTAEADKAKAEQDVAFQKSEAQKAFKARDDAKVAARSSFLETDEGKALKAKADEADALKTKLAVGGAQSGGGTQQQGQVDINKVVDERMNAILAEQAKTAEKTRVRDALAKAFGEVGALNVDTVMLLAEKHYLEPGTVKVENGKIVGLGKAVADLYEKQPFLFKGGSQALDRVKKFAGALDDGSAALNERGSHDKRNAERPLSLAEMTQGNPVQQPPHWRQLGKPPEAAKK